MSDNSPFWDAYRSAIKNALLPGVPLPDDDEIFSLPFTVSFTDATVPLTTEGVNYLLYNLADTTLANDGSTGKYATELNTYLNTVDETSLQDPTAKKKLDEAKVALNNAQKDFDKVEKEARAYYDQVPPPKPPFEQWVTQNYPPYAAARRTLDSAKTQYQQAYNAYWGRINALRGFQKNLAQALDTTALHQSYNMPVQQAGGAATFAPYYSCLGLKDQLNSWIQGGGQDQTFFEVKIDSISPTKTKDEGGIYLKFTTKGIRKFDINVGQWNVDNAKALYPMRETGAPDVLDPKYAQPLSFLLAYGPSITVEIKGDQAAQSIVTTDSDGKLYVTVLGILAQHFPQPN
ncbi:hypothetical protein H0H92_007485 [Tricholoma furcatifolium]|nr:hypothetical protein H0H92_007485 [Tricholoma furcatifolium]